jgi:hypothetical protein
VAAHNAVVLKAETIIDKTEWVTKIKSIIDSKESATKRPNAYITNEAKPFRWFSRELQHVVFLAYKVAYNAYILKNFVF